MDRLPTIAITLGIAACSILVFLGRTGRLALPDRAPAAPVAAGRVCTSSYFGNQCAAQDTPVILASRSDRAYSGRGYEAQVAFVGVWPTPRPGQSAIVGQRSDGRVICVTANERLAQAAKFELNFGDRAVLSGIIDRRQGDTVYLTHCAYWRA